MGFGSKCSMWNGQADHIENSKLNISDMRLISLDLVTYYAHTCVQQMCFQLRDTHLRWYAQDYCCMRVDKYEPNNFCQLKVWSCLLMGRWWDPLLFYENIVQVLVMISKFEYRPCMCHNTIPEMLSLMPDCPCTPWMIACDSKDLEWVYLKKSKNHKKGWGQNISDIKGVVV